MKYKTEQIYQRILDNRQKVEVKQDYFLIYKDSEDYTAFIVDFKSESIITHQIYLTNEYELLDYFQQYIYLRKYRVNYLSEPVACCQIKDYIRNKKLQKIFSQYFKYQTQKLQTYGISYSQSFDQNKVIFRKRVKTIRIIKISKYYTPTTIHFQNELFLSIQQNFIIQYKRTHQIWDELYLTHISKANKQLVGKTSQNHNIFDTQISPDCRFIYISPFLHNLQNFQEQLKIDGYVQFSNCSRFIIQLKNQQLTFISLQNYESEYVIDLQFDQIIPQSVQVQSKQQKIIFMTRQKKSKIQDQKKLLEKVIQIYKYERIQ